MLKHSILYPALVLLLSVPAMSLAQDCEEYLSRDCFNPSAQGFQYDERSQSVSLSLGETHRLKFTIGADVKIRFHICQNFGDVQLRWKLISPKTGKVIVDNANFKVKDEFEFTNRRKTRFWLEVSIEASGTDEQRSHVYESGCVGVFMEKMRL